MVKLAPVEYHSDYLDCGEVTLMQILRSMGLSEEVPLMGTQTYFVFREEKGDIAPRYHFTAHEWRRVYNLIVHEAVLHEAEQLDTVVTEKLDTGIPVCIPVDTYHLPHTSYYNRFHELHHINIFGYDSDRFFVVCPRYRFTGWVDRSLVHISFRSPTVDLKYMYFIDHLPEIHLPPEQAQSLILDSCQYMLGMRRPEPVRHMGDHLLGLAGMRSFSRFFRGLEATEPEVRIGQVRNLQGQISGVGNSRYWLHRFLQRSWDGFMSASEQEAMSELLSDITQSWKVTALMLVKGIIGERLDDLFPRAATRLERLADQEEHFFRRLLQTLTNRT